MSSTQPAWYGSQDNVQYVDTSTWTTVVNLGNYAVNPSVNNSGWNEDTGIFTVQSGQAGIYYAFGSAGINDIQTDDIVLVGFQKNNLDMSQSGYNNVNSKGISYGANDTITAQISQVFSLAVGDTLKLKVFHNEGSTEPTDPTYCYFGGFRIFAT